MQTFSSPFVGPDLGRLTGALVVAPALGMDGVEPIHGEPSPIATRASEQHQVLVRTLRFRGVRTIELDADPAMPYGSLAGDLAVVFPKGAVLMRPTELSRRAEVARAERALTNLGIP